MLVLNQVCGVISSNIYDMFPTSRKTAEDKIILEIFYFILISFNLSFFKIETQL